MKNSEFIIMTIGSLFLLGFVVFMLNKSYDSSKTNLIREDIKNDSIIFEQNNLLKNNDSVLKINNLEIHENLQKIEMRLEKLEKRRPIIRRDTIFIWESVIGE